MALFVDYELPPGRIAQQPVEPRDAARLLVLHRQTDQIEHRHVRDLPELLKPGDLVVVNDSRVLAARLLGHRVATGGKWEGLFLTAMLDGGWQLLCQTRGRLNVGEAIAIENSPLQLELLERPEGKPWVFRPNLPGSPPELLEQFGHVPLPPYIRKGRADENDRERYQTVFAQNPGSVAAPTAGLHLTPQLLNRLTERGIEMARVTLHVGLGTFLQLADGDPLQHKMHHEWCELPSATAEAIKACRARNGRIVAVGTTSVRTLESAKGQTWAGETDLFIHSPYDFQCVDVLMTNFHLPRTSLLLLVGAFAGSERLEQAYREAINRDYRFFSYGDAMLIL